jgi:hypothetical protein
MPPVKPDDPSRIFTWLGGSTVYLAPLNLVWSTDGMEADLARFRLAAADLSSDETYWRWLFRVAWREQLCASTCALLTTSRCFLTEFMDAVQAGTWVGPQLIVAATLLHPSEAAPWLYAGGISAFTRRRFKDFAAFSTMAATTGIDQPLPVVTPSELSPLEHDDFALGQSIAASQHQFWAHHIST